MSEMVERVAAAIDEAIEKWDPRASKFRDFAARAAIKAMCEPTETMVEAGYMADNGEDRNLGERGAKEAWQLMIDAALKD